MDQEIDKILESVKHQYIPTFDEIDKERILVTN